VPRDNGCRKVEFQEPGSFSSVSCGRWGMGLDVEGTGTQLVGQLISCRVWLLDASHLEDDPRNGREALWWNFTCAEVSSRACGPGDATFGNSSPGQAHVHDLMDSG